MLSIILDDKKLCYAIIKYKEQLENYFYVPIDNINSIPNGSYIQYISKKNFTKKNGIFKRIKDSYILEIYIFNYKKYIYIQHYYIFYKNKLRSSLKSILQNLVDNDFNLV